MIEEQIEEIDWNNNIVTIHPKSKLKTSMFPHRVITIIPKTENGKFLLAKRAKEKHPFPDTWCCGIGGKVSAGESVEKAAKREMLEEANLSVPLKKVTQVKYKKPHYQAIFQVFTTKESVSPNQLNPNQEEIQYFKEFSIQEVEAMIEQNPNNFAPTFIEIFNKFKTKF